MKKEKRGPAANPPAAASVLPRVTGGSRGLGRSCVESLAGRGVDSIFTFVKNRREAEAACEAVARAGRRAVALPLDIGQVADFDAFAGEVRRALGELGCDQGPYCPLARRHFWAARYGASTSSWRWPATPAAGCC